MAQNSSFEPVNVKDIPENQSPKPATANTQMTYTVSYGTLPVNKADLTAPTKKPILPGVGDTASGIGPNGEVFYELSTATIKEAGTGYTANDVLTIKGDITDATVTVNTVGDAGEITKVTVTTKGKFKKDISGDITPTGGTGSAGELTIKMKETL